MPTWFVVSIGIGIVFISLVCIVVLCSITGLFFKGKKEKGPALVTPAPKAATTVTENRGEIVAAISAVLAEELGTDVSALRIHSLKRL